MIFIEHRKNTCAGLQGIRPDRGVEADFRTIGSVPGSMHISHDPWHGGDLATEWFETCRRLSISGPLILNTKEDGLEESLMNHAQDAGLPNYVFLDTTYPTLIKYVKKGIGSRFFHRLSKYEPLLQAQQFRNQIQWLWVDCFDIEPLAVSILQEAKRDFRLCLVSPELQGGTQLDYPNFLPLARLSDAICTKHPEHWDQLLKGASV